MLVRTLLTALAYLLLAPAAWAALPDLCRGAIAATERATGVPDRLMQAVSIMESGRRDSGGPTLAWPWTINVEGVGEVFDTKQQAIDAVNAHRARGARSIDVGCMQVNLMHHPDAFASLDEAFDPAANARYAAKFLQQLLAQTGSWPLAVAGYHSLTPDIGGDYAKKVLAIWARPDTARWEAGARPPQQAGIASMGGGAAAGPHGAIAALPPPTRMAMQASAPAGGAPMMAGRGLDAYRAMPTRMAFALPMRRF